MRSRWSTGQRRRSRGCCGDRTRAREPTLRPAARLSERLNRTPRTMTEEPNDITALPQDGTPDPDNAAPVAPAEDPVAAVRRERDEYYDRMLRLTAEFDNYRKRIERERRE